MKKTIYTAPQAKTIGIEMKAMIAVSGNELTGDGAQLPLDPSLIGIDDIGQAVSRFDDDLPDLINGL